MAVVVDDDGGVVGGGDVGFDGVVPDWLVESR